jgi:hypothetical protein
MLLFRGLILFLVLAGTSFAQEGKLKPFQFRVKTKSGGIVNTNMMARDIFEAQYKLNKRYPDHTILNGHPGHDTARQTVHAGTVRKQTAANKRKDRK